MFVEQLAAASGPTALSEIAERPVHGRGDVTVVLTALRCGATVTEVLRFAPGLEPARLLSAYHDIESRRAAAHTAWNRLVADPAMSTLAQVGAAAALLLPTPVFHLASVAANTFGAGLPVATAKMHSRVSDASSLVDRVEAQLEFCTDHSEVMRKLFDPNRSGLVDMPHYLPRRVTTLSAIRVADLMGDRESVLEVSDGEVA